MRFLLAIPFLWTVSSSLIDSLTKYHVTTPSLLDRSQPTGSGHLSRVEKAFDAQGHARHVHAFSVKLNAFDEELTMDLSINKDLFSEDYYEMDDDVVARKGREHCYYTGRVRGEEHSVVAVNTCGEGLEGVFYRGNRRFGVAPSPKPVLSSEGVSFMQERAGGNHNTGEDQTVLLGSHLVYDVEDLIGKPEKSSTEDPHCTAGDSVLTPVNEAEAEAQRLQQKHQYEHEMHQHGQEDVNAATSRKLLATDKYLELLIVNENRMIYKHGTSSATNSYVVKLVNIITTLYNRFNSVPIHLTLRAQENWVTANPAEIGTVTASTDIQTLLSSFTSWSQKYSRLTSKGSPDAIHLYTGWNLSGSVSGVAWVGTMCGKSATGVNEDLGETYQVWAAETMTHELGHNLGSSHDGSGNSCAKSGSIMAAIGNAGGGRTTSSLDWSSCSENYISNKIQALSGTPSDCLSNVPTTTFGATSVCGDFVVSGNEECDVAINPTLCGTDCKLKPQKKCSTGACCTSTGSIKQKGIPCRTAIHQCDIEDVCDGVSSTCPSDKYKPDGTKCDEAGANGMCYKGSCMGYDGQCAEAFTQYKSYGDWITCLNPTIVGNGCGNLVCQIAGDPKKQCYALQDPSDSTDTRFVQVKEYTPCGGTTNKYCVSGSCVFKTGHDATCPNDCSGQGICSNDGECACNYGFTGEDCSTKLSCLDCAAMGREGCVSSELCGPCKEDRGSSDINDRNTACIYLAPPILRINASSEIDSTTAQAAFDKQPYIHWKADFSTGVAWLTAEFPEPTTIVQYELQSPNTLPQFDPRTWLLQGGNNDGAPWVTLDTQVDIEFEDRHLIKSFHISEEAQKPYSVFRLYFTAVRADDGGQLQLAEVKLYKDDHESVHDVGVLAGSASSTVPGLVFVMAIIMSLAAL